MVLQNEITQLESMMIHAHLKNEKISQRGIDWHLDHSFKVILATSDLLEKSNPEDYKWKFNFVRLVIFIKGSFPRGKGRSPKVVNNKEEILKEDLINQLDLVKTKLSQIESLPERANFKHPYFGYIKRDKTVKFLQMHTYHHFKIMRDIQSSLS